MHVQNQFSRNFAAFENLFGNKFWKISGIIPENFQSIIDDVISLIDRKISENFQKFSTHLCTSLAVTVLAVFRRKNWKWAEFPAVYISVSEYAIAEFFYRKYHIVSIFWLISSGKLATS